MTRVDESGHYPAAPAAVFDLIGDEEFRRASATSQGATSCEVTVSAEGDTTVVTLVREQPAEGVPDFITKIVGSTVKVKQVETWGPATADGGRAAEVRVKVIGQPAELTGSSVLRADDSGSHLSLTGDVKVPVPFLGRKIEPEIAKVIVAAFHHDIATGIDRLA